MIYRSCNSTRQNYTQQWNLYSSFFIINQNEKYKVCNKISILNIKSVIKCTFSQPYQRNTPKSIWKILLSKSGKSFSPHIWPSDRHIWEIWIPHLVTAKLAISVNDTRSHPVARRLELVFASSPPPLTVNP